MSPLGPREQELQEQPELRMEPEHLEQQELQELPRMEPRMEQELLVQLELLELQEPREQQEHREPRKEQELLQQPGPCTPPRERTCPDCRSARLSSATAPSSTSSLTSTPAWLRTSLLTAPAGPDMPSLSRRLFRISSFSSPCRCRLFLKVRATRAGLGSGRRSTCTRGSRGSLGSWAPST